MQREVLNVPRDLMRSIEVNWTPDWRGQSLPEANSGVSTVVYNRFPRWVGSPRLVLSGSRLLAWRAIRAKAQGRKNLYRVPMVDPVGFNHGLAAERAGVGSEGLPFSTGAYFSTGHGFSYDPAAVAVGGFARGADEIRLDTAAAGFFPVVGQIMSHDDRPFIVTEILETSEAECTVGIQMPLRASIPDGAPVLMQGRGIFEAAEEGMGNPSYGVDLVSRVRLSFQEYLNR